MLDEELDEELDESLFDHMCYNLGPVGYLDSDLIGDYEDVDPSLAYWYE